MVKEGYKQTEVGVIPEDWEASTIGDNTNWLSGGTPPRNNEEFWAGTIPWISGSTLKNAEIYTSDQFLTEEGVFVGSKMAPLKSTLLLVRGSALHNEIRAGLVVKPVCFNQDVKALIPDLGLEPKFLTFYILGMTNELLKLVSTAGNSAGVLDTGLVQNFPLLKPELKEQKAIAQALSDTDLLIASLEKLIAKKRDIKTATMQQLLTGKKRLPGFGEDEGIQQTELGDIPEDWCVHEIGDLGKFKNGINKDSEEFGHGYPLINLMDVFGVTSLDGRKTIGLVNSTSTDRKTYDLKKGDVLFIRSSVKPSGVGLTAVVDDDIKDAVFSGFLIRFRDNGALDVLYKKYCFYNEGFRERVIASSTVSANTNINQDSLKKVLLVYPQLKKEQNAIAQILADIDADLTALVTKLQKTKAIKQGMMQELLTGKTRLI